MKITLEKATVVVLDLDGSLVYVEDVQPTYAAVLALPDQPARSGKVVLTPGAITARKISPFSTAVKEVQVADLSDKNKEFIGTFETLRTTKRKDFIFGKENDVTVTKAQPERKTRGTGKRALRRQAKAAAEPVAKTKDVPRYKQRCKTCNEQPGHPNHGTRDGEHEFVAPDVVTFKESPRKETPSPTGRTPRGPELQNVKRADTTYTLISPDLTKAQSTERGDRYKEGNRCGRVIVALAHLPSSTGTIEQVVEAVMNDGDKPMANPEKVVRRTLNQCTTDEFGAIVRRNA